MFQLDKFITADELTEFCRRHEVKKLSLFGSALRDELKPDSDIDILVEFDPAVSHSLMKIAGMEIELGNIIGRRIDLRTPAELSRFFRKDVLAQARVEYAA